MEGEGGTRGLVSMRARNSADVRNCKNEMVLIAQK